MPQMKRLGILLAASLCSASAFAPDHRCVFESGTSVETEFPCTPAMVEQFSKRVIDLYPGLHQINTSPDYLMNLYVFAMAGCIGRFASLSPEQIGEASEPFFPKEMAAAMARVAREVICPAQQ